MGREATLLVVLTLFLLFLQKIAGGGQLECNGTSIGDCLVDGDEFLMESETSTMLLANGKDPLAFKGLQKPQICDAKIIGNCIGAQLNGIQRPCTFDNRCKHMPNPK